MARIVGVHGVGHQFNGPVSFQDEWLRALNDGIVLAGGAEVSEFDLGCAFYGDLFRPSADSGAHKGAIPAYDATDITGEWEIDMLREWADAVVGPQNTLPGGDGKKGLIGSTLVRTASVHRLLEFIEGSPFFGGVATPFLIFDLKQVKRYLHDLEIRDATRGRFTEAVDPIQTQVVVAHSLGSVVAYEVLCANPKWKVTTFVTIGCPLATPKLIFEELDPAPVSGVGAWPGSVTRWVNIADKGDIVALKHRLADHFGSRVQDVLVHNGSHAHDAMRYLRAKETGKAILEGL